MLIASANLFQPHGFGELVPLGIVGAEGDFTVTSSVPCCLPEGVVAKRFERVVFGVGDLGPITAGIVFVFLGSIGVAR